MLIWQTPTLTKSQEFLIGNHVVIVFPTLNRKTKQKRKCKVKSK